MSVMPKQRRSVFDMLDDPEFGKKSRQPCGKGKAPCRLACAVLDAMLQARFEDAQRMAGLSGSDLMRQGLRRAIDELERPGQLIVRAQEVEP